MLLSAALSMQRQQPGQIVYSKRQRWRCGEELTDSVARGSEVPARRAFTSGLFACRGIQHQAHLHPLQLSARAWRCAVVSLSLLGICSWQASCWLWAAENMVHLIVSNTHHQVTCQSSSQKDPAAIKHRHVPGSQGTLAELTTVLLCAWLNFRGRSIQALHKACFC